jgi:cobalt-precorrin-5B (C1)-methyltransferase
MGDFVGGFLKYVRAHSVARVTIGGGFAKMTKLAQGRLDLHSGRSVLDLPQLAQLAGAAGASARLVGEIATANSALDAFLLAQAAGVDLAAPVAARAWETAARTLDAAAIELEILVFDREGGLLARAPFRSAGA